MTREGEVEGGVVRGAKAEGLMKGEAVMEEEGVMGKVKECDGGRCNGGKCDETLTFLPPVGEGTGGPRGAGAILIEFTDLKVILILIPSSPLHLGRR